MMYVVGSEAPLSAERLHRTFHHKSDLHLILNSGTSLRRAEGTGRIEDFVRVEGLC